MNKLKKNDIIAVEITAMSYGGMGIARLSAPDSADGRSGMVVFVENSVVGDRAEVRILKTAKTHCFAKIERMIAPSPNRLQPECTYFGKCGCCFAGFSYDEELKYKKTFVEDAFKKFSKIDTEIKNIIPSPVRTHYRNKVQYPVGMGSDGNIKIGFYRKRSHRIIDIDCCNLQSPVFDPVIPTVRSWMNKYNITPYNELTGHGLIRHICGRTAVHTASTMIILVVNGETLPHSDKLYEMLRNEIPTLKSLILNINKERGNVIMGSRSITLKGESYITEKLDGLEFNVSANSFFQINPYQTAALYNSALDAADLQGTETVFDFYSGVGTIAQFFARQAKSVVGIEIVPDAVKDAKRNAGLNRLENCRFICGDTAEISKKLFNQRLKPDIITVDPARRGLDPEAVKTMADLQPQKIIYISCDPITLARDAELFRTFGYKTQSIQPFDMFPGTYHVESVVCLTRRKK